MKLKIISDGTQNGAKLINADTNEIIEGVSVLAVDIDASTMMFKVIAEFSNIPVEFTSPAQINLFELQEPDFEKKKYQVI